MRSLSLKLIGAFALVILLGAIVTYAVSVLTASSQFSTYVSRRAQAQAASWAPLFAAYYQRTGSWSGAESVASSLAAADMSPGGGGQGWGGSGQEHGAGRGRGLAAGPVQAWDVRLLLADVDGRVVVDSAGEAVGQLLEAAELAQGTPIVSLGQRVGTLVMVTPMGVHSGLAADFLSSLP